MQVVAPLWSETMQRQPQRKPGYIEEAEQVLASQRGETSRRRDCHFADTPSPSALEHLLKGEGVQQNDSLTDD